MTEHFNVLVSSAGRRVALVAFFEQSLRDLGLRGEVIASDHSKLSAAFQRAATAVQVPPCDSDQFIPAMLELCRQHDVRLIVPTIDTELPVYAHHRERLADAGATVAISDSETIAIAADKVRTHEWLMREGIPTVRQGSIEEVAASPDAWPFPLLVKPRQGSASIGVAVVRSPAALQAAAELGDVVVQSFAPGSEFTVDVFVDRTGRARCAVPRQRIEVRAGEVSKGITVKCHLAQELASKVCNALPGAFGALNVQMFLDDSEPRARVIEVNPRFGGGFPLSWECGAAFPRWLVEEVAGLPSSAEPDGWRAGRVMLRYDEAVFVDAEDAGI